MTLLKENIISRKQNIILFLLFMYDAFSYLPESANFAVLKVLYYCVICYYFVQLRFLQRETNVKGGAKSLILIGWLVFLFFYLIRILYDLFIKKVPQEITTNNYTIPILFICATFIPLLGFRRFNFSIIDYISLAKALLLCYGFLIALSFYYFYTGQAFDYILADGRMQGNASMDTISFGHFGLSLTIISFFVIWNEWSRRNLWVLIALCCMILGFATVLSAGSRGAFVAMLICVMFLLWINKKRVLAISAIPLILVGFYFLFPIINVSFESIENSALQRFYDSLFTDMDPTTLTSKRDLLYEEGINLALEHPIFGYSFLLDGSYVHNFFLEALLSVGFFGGFLFTILSVSCVFFSLKLAQSDCKYWLITILYIQYSVFSLFSRSMSILPIYWTLTFLIVYSYVDNKYKNKCDKDII